MPSARFTTLSKTVSLLIFAIAGSAQDDTLMPARLNAPEFQTLILTIRADSERWKSELKKMDFGSLRPTKDVSRDLAKDKAHLDGLVETLFSQTTSISTKESLDADN